jgi:hypothetical protein
MRSQNPSPDRGEPAFDVTVQIVLNDFGQPLGRVYRRSALCEISDARLITAGIDDRKLEIPAATLGRHGLSGRATAVATPAKTISRREHIRMFTE